MAVTTDDSFDLSKLKIAVVVSRFNSSITKSLQASATEFLIDAGVEASNIKSFWVPGAFEIPQVVRDLALSEEYDGILPLGCVIRGETPHFEYVCEAATLGLAQLALDSSASIVLGVLTTENIEQAKARSGGQTDKGIEAANALLELIEVRSKIKSS